jgi:hypothetical protein
VDNPQTAYDMLMDLVERLVLEDTESGVLVDTEESKAA